MLYLTEVGISKMVGGVCAGGEGGGGVGVNFRSGISSTDTE